LTFLIEAKISFAQAGSFAKITHRVIFIRSALFQILAFLHFIATLRSKKIGKKMGQKDYFVANLKKSR
jgi:hypothetical protein